MAAEDGRLRLALVAYAGNAAQDITAAELAGALHASLGATPADVEIKPFHPENFLILCNSNAIRGRILDAGSVPVRDTAMFFRQWTRLARATPAILYIRVNIELDGIPPHAWSLDTASKLLAPSCWVEKLHEDTASKRDLSTFRLTAWTRDISTIPTSRPLEVAEPERTITHSDPAMQLIFGRLPPYLRQKKTLTYQVLIRIRSVADFAPRSPSPSPSPPSSDGDSGHDGNPDRGYGESRGQGPRLQGFPAQRGGEDDPSTGFMPSYGDGAYDAVAALARSGTCGRRPVADATAAPFASAPSASPSPCTAERQPMRPPTISAATAGEVTAVAPSNVAVNISNPVTEEPSMPPLAADARQLEKPPCSCFPEKEKQKVESSARSTTANTESATRVPARDGPRSEHADHGATEDPAVVCFHKQTTVNCTGHDPMLIECRIRRRPPS
ncbi:unnamed protein product [Urochloa humidicola]